MSRRALKTEGNRMEQNLLKPGPKYSLTLRTGSPTVTLPQWRSRQTNYYVGRHFSSKLGSPWEASCSMIVACSLIHSSSVSGTPPRPPAAELPVTFIGTPDSAPGRANSDANSAGILSARYGGKMERQNVMTDYRWRDGMPIAAACFEHELRSGSCASALADRRRRFDADLPTPNLGMSKAAGEQYNEFSIARPNSVP